METKRKFFIGIDLGGKTKKTTGLCILEETEEGLRFFHSQCRYCGDLKYVEVLKTIKPFLAETCVIAADGPLTKGKGKGLMRLYEKFLSTRPFREEKISPLPPILMPEVSAVGQNFAEKLKKSGFVLDKNLIETFTTFVKKICPDDFVFQFLKEQNFQPDFVIPCQVSSHQQSALVCAVVAYLHPQFKTRYLGYRDGFLTLPEINLWKPEWREKFYQIWMKRDRLRYHHLTTNIFSK
ncbi:MAG: hypothetical protein V1756_01305 [Patescibacteria group bacterium]